MPAMAQGREKKRLMEETMMQVRCADCGRLFEIDRKAIRLVLRCESCEQLRICNTPAIRASSPKPRIRQLSLGDPLRPYRAGAWD